MKVTPGELHAWELLQRGWLTNESEDYHQAGNEIIKLAEQIKRERSAITYNEVKAVYAPIIARVKIPKEPL
jgi:hypothetical protein